VVLDEADVDIESTEGWGYGFDFRGTLRGMSSGVAVPQDLGAIKGVVLGERQMPTFI